MAKMDHEDSPFDRELIEQKYPENYPLVPGHVWLVATDEENSYDVARELGLVSGGNEDASGIVVPQEVIGGSPIAGYGDCSSQREKPDWRTRGTHPLGA